MALSIPQSFQGRFMKEGARAFKGLDEVVLRNIEACSELGNQLRTTFGPNGMNKLIINDIEKEFVTTDAATIIRELDVIHPAAQLLSFAAQCVEEGPGDGVNTAVILSVALLEGAGELIRAGLKPVEVIDGYTEVHKSLMEKIESFVIAKATELHDVKEVKKYLKAAVMSKQLIHVDKITELAAEACVQVSSKSGKAFNVDNVRMVKIPGGTINDSTVVNGMVFHRASETDRRSVENAKVALFACPFDILQTETKGTVLLNNADELMEFSGNEEKEVEKQIKELHDAGINVVVAAGKFGDLYIHYLNKYNIMGVRLVSKFDLRRLCRMLGAPAQAVICTPSLDHVGQCDKVSQKELSGQQTIVFEKSGQTGSIASIVIRGATMQQMNDVERALDDAINNYKLLTRDNRLVGGAGTFEVQVARHVEYLANKNSTVSQYVMHKFGQAYQSLPKQLAKNAGLNETQALASLIAEQKKNDGPIGIDIFEAGKYIDVKKENIYDSYLAKAKAIEVAVDSAIQILRVDQIIMARAAGGPNLKAPRPQDPEGNDDGMA
ncbi:hypothetical protein FO519_007524 [Halicephalobus sp. NKZ332]|nr:hypothetical protein FO519_007524 [Halicephalobus sp. NKZ332]